MPVKPGISATHGITGVVGGTGLVALSRKLGEPWQSGLALASPALSFLWAALLAVIFGWFDRWQLERDTREVERGLTRLTESAEALPDGPERSALEQHIQEIRGAIIAKHVRALKYIAGRDEQEAPHAVRRRPAAKAKPKPGQDNTT